MINSSQLFGGSVRGDLPIARQSAYTRVMRFLPRPQPTSALSDVVRAIRTPVPHKLGIMGLSAALTYLLISSLIHDFSPKPVHHAPDIIYIKQWPKSRTLAQVKIQQAIDAPLEKAAKEKEIADDAAAAAARRAQFKRAQEILSSYGIR